MNVAPAQPKWKAARSVVVSVAWRTGEFRGLGARVPLAYARLSGTVAPHMAELVALDPGPGYFIRVQDVGELGMIPTPYVEDVRLLLESGLPTSLP